jgi:hypothetical protein
VKKGSYIRGEEEVDAGPDAPRPTRHSCRVRHRRRSMSDGWGATPKKVRIGPTASDPLPATTNTTTAVEIEGHGQRGSGGAWIPVEQAGAVGRPSTQKKRGGRGRRPGGGAFPAACHEATPCTCAVQRTRAGASCRKAHRR